MLALTEAHLEARARRAAKRVGLLARKSRQRRSLDNHGGFMLVEPRRNYLVAGEHFDLTAEDVIDWCREAE